MPPETRRLLSPVRLPLLALAAGLLAAPAATQFPGGRPTPRGLPSRPATPPAPRGTPHLLRPAIQNHAPRPRPHPRNAIVPLDPAEIARRANRSGAAGPAPAAPAAPPRPAPPPPVSKPLDKVPADAVEKFAARESARKFFKLRVPGRRALPAVRKLLKLEWHGSLDRALAVAGSAGKPVLYIQALGDLRGYT